MSENMEEVTFIKNAIFDRKVRKPSDKPLTVSAGEAENLRRIGVVAEKGEEAEKELDNLNDETKAESELDNRDVTDAPDQELEPESTKEPEPENKMPQALPSEAPKPKKRYSMKKKKSGK